MNLTGRRVCLVSSTHAAANPRAVKEADALAAAGADVTLVSVSHTALYRALDADLLANRHWRWITVDTSRRGGLWHYIRGALLERLLRSLPAASWQLGGVAEAALSRLTERLDTAMQRAAPEADLYIAHNLQALPAAAAAARRTGAKLGFDLEDCHWGELTAANRHLRDLVRCIEDRYLPACDHLTAASPMISTHYRERLGKPITTVLNVFPLSELSSQLVATPLAQQKTSVSLYWFSQTLGPGRGLEWVIEALKLLNKPVRLVLRGNPIAGYPEQLLRLAGEGSDLAQRIEFLPIAPPALLAAACAEHDIGLAVETHSTLNRQLCLTNKIFHYLLAGMPVLLSDTPAQLSLAESCGEAMKVAPYGDAAALAQTLEPWLSDPKLLARAKEKASQLAKDRYCWDVEKDTFLSLIEKTLS